MRAPALVPRRRSAGQFSASMNWIGLVGQQSLGNMLKSIIPSTVFQPFRTRYSFLTTLLSSSQKDITAAHGLLLAPSNVSSSKGADCRCFLWMRSSMSRTILGRDFARSQVVDDEVLESGDVVTSSQRSVRLTTKVWSRACDLPRLDRLFAHCGHADFPESLELSGQMDYFLDSHHFRDQYCGCLCLRCFW